jgi:hypothetical protein
MVRKESGATSFWDQSSTADAVAVSVRSGAPMVMPSFSGTTVATVADSIPGVERSVSSARSTSTYDQHTVEITAKVPVVTCAHKCAPRVRADAEGQADNGRDRERRIAPESADGVAEIGHEVGQTAGECSHGLQYVDSATEFQER